MSTLKHSAVEVLAADDSDRDAAKALAESLALPLCPDIDANSCRHLLICDSDKVFLIDQENQKMRPLFVDFTDAAYKRRLKQASKQTLLAKAIGMKSQYRPSVIDATAGLGKDAFLLAYLGCEITMIEASPVVYALLSNGLDRAYMVDDFVEMNGRIKVRLGDANQIFAEIPAADVVYLDPMYPDNKKKALSKRDMQYLQAFLTAPSDMETLFSAALQFAKKRVVVKRPLKGKPMTATKAPNYSLCGSSTRFDVYLSDVSDASTSNTAP